MQDATLLLDHPLPTYHFAERHIALVCAALPGSPLACGLLRGLPTLLAR